MEQTTKQSVGQDTVTALDHILKTESEALALIAQARERTRQIVAQAQEQVPDIAIKGEHSARKLASEKTKLIQKNTRETISRLDKERGVRCEELKIELENKYEGALAYIVQLVTETSESATADDLPPSAVSMRGANDLGVKEGGSC